MKRRKIDPEVKMAAVLEALRGESTIAEICRKYQISETLLYCWWGKIQEQGAEKNQNLEDLGEILLKKIDRP